MAIGGVVAGFFSVGAVVLILVAFLFEIFLDELLERKSGMIGCYTNFHIIRNLE